MKIFVSCVTYNRVRSQKLVGEETEDEKKFRTVTSFILIERDDKKKKLTINIFLFISFLYPFLLNFEILIEAYKFPL